MDRRLGKGSGKRVPADRQARVEALYRRRDAGFTAKHFHEHLVRGHQFVWGHTWTKTFLHSKGLALDHDDIGWKQSKIINVIDSKSLERDAGNRVPLFLIPLSRAERRKAGYLLAVKPNQPTMRAEVEGFFEDARCDAADVDLDKCHGRIE